jgi:hypothetical protein
VQKIRAWLDEHSMDELGKAEPDSEDVFKYLGENSDTGEITVMWSGKEISAGEDASMQLIPLMRDGE